MLFPVKSLVLVADSLGFRDYRRLLDPQRLVDLKFIVGCSAFRDCLKLFMSFGLLRDERNTRAFPLLCEIRTKPLLTTE